LCSTESSTWFSFPISVPLRKTRDEICHLQEGGLYNESLFVLSYVVEVQVGGQAADVTDKTQFVISPILFKPLELSEI
jgi:hypothetical protein